MAVAIRPKKTVQGVVRYPVKQGGRFGLLRLDKNENCAGWPAGTLAKILAGVSRHFLSAYPEPITLYEKIAKWHGIERDRLLVTAGSEMAIRYAFEAYLAGGDEIVMLNPSFAMFEVYAALTGAKVVRVDFDRRFCVSTTDILRRISRRTKIVAIANPNNPTGSVIPEDDLVAIIKKAAKHHALVLVDEAYYHFYNRTMLPYTAQFDNVLLTRTFSKAYGAASVRLGYAIGHPEVIATMNKLQPIDHVNGFAVLVGEYLIDHPELVARYVQEVEKGRAIVLRELDRMGLSVASGFGNFVMVDLGERKSQLVERLAALGVMVGSNLRLPFPSNHIRVTLGPPREMRRFCRALKDVWA